MKASELIKELQDLICAHGDVNVIDAINYKVEEVEYVPSIGCFRIY